MLRANTLKCAGRSLRLKYARPMGLNFSRSVYTYTDNSSEELDAWGNRVFDQPFASAFEFIEGEYEDPTLNPELTELLGEDPYARIEPAPHDHFVRNPDDLYLYKEGKKESYIPDFRGAKDGKLDFKAPTAKDYMDIKIAMEKDRVNEKAAKFGAVPTITRDQLPEYIIKEDEDGYFYDKEGKVVAKSPETPEYNPDVFDSFDGEVYRRRKEILRQFNKIHPTQYQYNEKVHERPGLPPYFNHFRYTQQFIPTLNKMTYDGVAPTLKPADTFEYTSFKELNNIPDTEEDYTDNPRLINKTMNKNAANPYYMDTLPLHTENDLLPEEEEMVRRRVKETCIGREVETELSDTEQMDELDEQGSKKSVYDPSGNEAFKSFGKLDHSSEVDSSDHELIKERDFKVGMSSLSDAHKSKKKYSGDGHIFVEPESDKPRKKLTKGLYFL